MAADDAFDVPGAGEDEEEVMGGLDGMDDEEDDDFPVSIKVGEEKEIGKQGLRKKLVKEGEGWERPETGDEIEGTQRMPALPLYASLLFQLLFDR
jgi:FK506-binding protein 4/5